MTMYAKYTDDFAGTGALGEAWIDDLVGGALFGFNDVIERSSGVAANAAAGQGGAFYDEPLANNQYCQLTTVSMAATVVIPCVRGTLDGPNYAGYVWVVGTGGGYIQKFDGVGGYATIAATVGFTVGDIIKLEADGESVSAYVNGELIATQEDSTYTSGIVGFALNDTSTMDNWEAGDDVEPVSGLPGMNVEFNTVGQTSVRVANNARNTFSFYTPI